MDWRLFDCIAPEIISNACVIIFTHVYPDWLCDFEDIASFQIVIDLSGQRKLILLILYSQGLLSE